MDWPRVRYFTTVHFHPGERRDTAHKRKHYRIVHPRFWLTWGRMAGLPFRVGAGCGIKWPQNVADRWIAWLQIGRFTVCLGLLKPGFRYSLVDA